MTSTAALLHQVVADLHEALCDDTLAGLADADRLAVLQSAGEASRLVDAVVVESVASARPTFARETGCRGDNDLVQRMLLTDARSAAVLDRAAGRMRRDTSLLTGERMPAAWPALRDAVLDGAVSLPGFLAATTPFEKARDRISAEDRAWADQALAWSARGYRTDDADAPDTADADGHPGPPMTAADLGLLALALATALDPDGAEPSDDEAARSRGVTINPLKNGTHRVHGELLPEVAAQLQRIFDAYDNPKVGGAPATGVRFSPGDEAVDAPDAGAHGSPASTDPFNTDDRAAIDVRTPAQRRHDALAAALGIAARHKDMPSLGGAAPTLVVQADLADIARGTGWATVPGSQAPVPIRTALHTACAGVVQRVLFDRGRIVGISILDRIFSAAQRRAIVLRDKECLIPGCHTPAEWCEIHHVEEASRGGPTSTGNGVPLCWWHHRGIDDGPWEIRMVDGLPQIRGPEWWDPDQRWRTPLRSLPLHEHAAGA